MQTQRAAGDDAFVSVEPGEIIKFRRLSVGLCHVGEFLGCVGFSLDAELGRRFFDEGARDIGIAAVYFARGRVQHASPRREAMFRHVHFIADGVREKDGVRGAFRRRHVAVVEGNGRHVKFSEQFGDAGNGCLAARIDETDTVEIQAVAERLGEVAERAVLRFALDQDGAMRKQRFFHFREMHDKVLFDVRVETEPRPARRRDLSVPFPIQTDDFAVIVDERVRRMRHDENLAVQPVDSQYFLQEMNENGIFVAKQFSQKRQYGALLKRMETKLRLVNPDEKRQIAFPILPFEHHIGERHRRALFSFIKREQKIRRRRHERLHFARPFARRIIGAINGLHQTERRLLHRAGQIDRKPVARKKLRQRRAFLFRPGKPVAVESAQFRQLGNPPRLRKRIF